MKRHFYDKLPAIAQRGIEADPWITKVSQIMNRVNNRSIQGVYDGPFFGKNVVIMFWEEQIFLAGAKGAADFVGTYSEGSLYYGGYPFPQGRYYWMSYNDARYKCYLKFSNGFLTIAAPEYGQNFGFELIPTAFSDMLRNVEDRVCQYLVEEVQSSNQAPQDVLDVVKYVNEAAKYASESPVIDIPICADRLGDLPYGRKRNDAIYYAKLVALGAWKHPNDRALRDAQMHIRSYNDHKIGLNRIIASRVKNPTQMPSLRRH